MKIDKKGILNLIIVLAVITIFMSLAIKEPEPDTRPDIFKRYERGDCGIGKATLGEEWFNYFENTCPSISNTTHIFSDHRCECSGSKEFGEYVCEIKIAPAFIFVNDTHIIARIKPPEEENRENPPKEVYDIEYCLGESE